MTLGRRGEAVGWNFLIHKGYTILEKNYRCPLGEIDVVAEKEGRLAFLEIKTRKSPAYGPPEEAVHPVKQKKLLKLAAWYMKAQKREEAPASFHVLAITWRGALEPEIRLIEDAFSADDLLI